MSYMQCYYWLPYPQPEKKNICSARATEKGKGWENSGLPLTLHFEASTQCSHAEPVSLLSQKDHLKTGLQELPRLDRRKKNLPDPKDPVNTAMHRHTQTYPMCLVINTLLNFVRADASNVNLSTKEFWLPLKSVLNMEGLSVTWVQEAINYIPEALSNLRGLIY